MKQKSAPPVATPRVRKTLGLAFALPVLLVLGMLGFMAWQKANHQDLPVRHISSKPFATVSITNLTVNLFAQGETLRPGGDDLFLEFRDRKNALVDVGAVTFEMYLHMPDMVSHSIGKVLRTATPGQYRTTLAPPVGGAWEVKIGFTGPLGTSETSFNAVVK